MKHKHPTSRRCRAIPAFTAALFAAGFLTNSHAQIQSAGTLFVNVDATGAAEGPLTSIPNTGTLGGAFAATGPAGEAPVIATVGSTKGIQMDGNDFLQLMTAATGGTPIMAPAELTGLNPTRSIEVWAYNPALAGEETLVSWGRRGGGPDGSNMSFNYGSDFRWGAVGHWGNQDQGWNNNGGGPAAGRWHHLVYTYDGDETRVYSDGAFQNGEYVGPDRINTHPNTPILIGAQSELDTVINDGVTTRVTPGLRFTGTIAKVRIHDGVLTAEQIAANYNAERASFVDPVIPPPPVVVSAPLTKTPVHRYSFSEPAGDASFAAFSDSVQDAHGLVLGNGATFTGTRLALLGGPSSDAAYGDLPNGLLSSNAVVNGGSGQFSFETWYKNTGPQNWGRIFDFGSTGGAIPAPTEELFGPGGGGEGRDYLMYSTSIGTDVNNRRLELRNFDPIDEGIVTVDNPTTTHNQDAHIVVTWDEATGRLTTYENGRQVSTMVTDDTMDDINDVNVWLGRSNWTGDANAQGEYDEVRLYSHVLSPSEVLGNTFAGPNKYSTEATAVTITTQPQSVTVNENVNVTFDVGLSGSSPIQIQWYRDGNPIPNAISPRLTLTNVTAADNDIDITVRATNVVNGTSMPVTSSIATLTVNSPPPPPAPTLRHKYDFNETTGTTVTDSVGDADGTVFNGGTFGGGQLTLPGAPPNTPDGPYVDLPNGVISGLGQDGTIEIWFTHSTYLDIWTRVFDFGISTAGEDAQSAGQDFIFWVARNNEGFPRFEMNFPNSDALTVLIPNPPGWVPGEVETHAVVSYSNSRNIAELFLDGVLVATTTAPRPLSDFAGFDVNNWLGKAQWPDAYWAGSYNELRLYSGSMTADRVAASFAAGPDGTAVVRPTITVSRTATSMTLSWPASATGYILESSTSLAPGATWSEVAGATPNGGNMQVTVPTSDTMRFFRLKR
jgi:hypothetical protein